MYGKQNRIINWLVKNKFVDPAFIKYGEITDDMITWKSGGNQGRID